MNRSGKASRAARQLLSLRDKVVLHRQAGDAARRLTIRSAIKAARQRYDRSGNPIHVWQVVWMSMQPGAPVVPLPRWCANYLWEAADNLMQLAAGQSFRDGAELRRVGVGELVAQALGLSQAFRRLRSDDKKIARKLAYDKHRLAGLDHAAALASADGRAVEHDAIKKSVRAGKRLLAHAPVGRLHAITAQWKRLGRRQSAGPKGKI